MTPLGRPQRADAIAASTVMFLAVPQGLAYATIAGLPPAMGLFAATVPTIVGSLLRSSSHVVVGPTNALSLLVGAAVVGTTGEDAAAIAVTLAFLVGVFQLVATVLRLGAIVDYISTPIVVGYISGAAVLIGAGQLHNLTGTATDATSLAGKVTTWFAAIPDADPLTVGVAVATVGIVIALRHINRRLPAATIAMSLGIVATVAFRLETHGLKVVSDIAPIPAGLPPLTTPAFDQIGMLVPVAVACTVLSLVESNAVARSIASRTGEQLHTGREFLGQGAANLVAAFVGGYPVSGSLSRSVLNEAAGGRTRWSGAITGAAMLVVLLAFGTILDHTPIAALAGLLLVVAYDLFDVPRILSSVRASRADATALVATMVGTWVLTLDQAIYLGVALSIVMFLHRARFLTTSELTIDEEGVVIEHHAAPERRRPTCRAIRILQVEGALFFGAAAELQRILHEAGHDPDTRVVILRIKRAGGMDATVAQILADASTALSARAVTLILVGMRAPVMDVLERSGAAQAIGRHNLFPAGDRTFASLQRAREAAVAIDPDAHSRSCPVVGAPRLDGRGLGV